MKNIVKIMQTVWYTPSPTMHRDPGPGWWKPLAEKSRKTRQKRKPRK